MIFFLYGEDTFRSKEKLSEIKQAFSEKNPFAEVAFFDFSEKGTDLNGLLEAFYSSGLFSTKKMILIENALTHLPADSQKKLLEKLKQSRELQADIDMLIVFKESGVPKKTLLLWKYLASNSKSQQFNVLSHRELEKWAVEYSKKNSPKISFAPKALSLLISYIGNDLFLLKNELEKLINYKSEGKISEEDIDLLVSSQIHSNIFQATEALLNKDKRLALKLLHEQIKKGEDYFYILSMYAYHLRTLLKIASSIENGSFSAEHVAKETGLHPYVVKKSLTQAKLAGVEKLKNLFKKIQKIDSDSKTGKVDIRLALDKFIAQI